ncbi:energy transducer TonB [Pseudoxanthomonas sp.]|uniref:energy transducer TonB n=1 Tax=Pseudoxanthomonas sp. TaxID=1871049 RepID=UPI002605D73B|nr:energy transducer TonB [Pseudoxanthomonas sp.]WDS35424.1 MAG: energy transducer TonB [Pseudoxanthomonas sp.]
MSKVLGMLLLLVGLVPLAHAADLQMQVVGEVGIDPDGKVFATDIKTIVTPQVKDLIEKTVRDWQFEPVLVDGKPGHVKANMNLTLLAKKSDGGYQLQVERARFYSARATTRMTPPRYPPEPARAGIGANVLVAVRVDAQGKVIDAVAVETSLPYRNVNAKVARSWGKYFEKATIQAARDWEFAPARVEFGDVADATLIVPVTYRIGEMPSDGWQNNSEGERRQIPWLATESQQFDPAGLKQGESLALNQRVKLRTQVEGITL